MRRVFVDTEQTVGHAGQQGITFDQREERINEARAWRRRSPFFGTGPAHSQDARAVLPESSKWLATFTRRPA